MSAVEQRWIILVAASDGGYDAFTSARAFGPYDNLSVAEGELARLRREVWGWAEDDVVVKVTPLYVEVPSSFPDGVWDFLEALD